MLPAMNTTPNPTTPDTVVLIHGLWLNARSWEPWVERYEQRGLKVIATSWPGMDGDIAALRADTSGFDDLGIDAILDHYTQIIDGLEQPPIIIGHSFGGAFTQVRIDRGLGAAGVAIDSGPVKGILKLPVSQLRAGFPVLKNPLNRHRAVPITADEFHYAFTNTLSDEESAKVYERYWVPGPGRVLFEGALANLSPHSPLHVDFHNADRAPLYRRRRRPHRAAIDQRVQLQALQVRRGDGAQGLPGAPALPRGIGWLGRGRGLRDRLVAS